MELRNKNGIIINRGVDQLDREGASPILKLNYVYEAQALLLAAGGTAQDTINIEADSDFIWLKGSYQADIAGAAQTDSSRVIPNVTVQIRETGSARQFFNAPVPIQSIFGTGQIPFILPVGQMLRLASTLVVEFESFDAAAVYNVRLAFIGYKRFLSGKTGAY